MRYPVAFLALLDELERYELPPRHRLRDGEIVGGNVRFTVAIRSSAHVTAIPPLIIGTGSRHLIVRASGTGYQPIFGRMGALVQFTPVQQAPARRLPLKPRAPRSRNEPPAPRPKRSAEAIAASAAKIRAQRQARIAAVLPLVEQARAEGCVLLSEICQWLDDIGHPPPQGSQWAVATLCRMLPRDQERRDRDNASAHWIEQAKDNGAGSLREIADWMNARGHRTARNKEWTRHNLDRFIRDRARAGSEP